MFYKEHRQLPVFFFCYMWIRLSEGKGRTMIKAINNQRKNILSIKSMAISLFVIILTSILLSAIASVLIISKKIDLDAQTIIGAGIISISVLTGVIILRLTNAQCFTIQATICVLAFIIIMLFVNTVFMNGTFHGITLKLSGGIISFVCGLLICAKKRKNIMMKKRRSR